MSRKVPPELIAARSAKHGIPSKSPFGPDDEVGMLNLITPESRQEILSKADATRVYDLANDFFIGMPAWVYGGAAGFQIFMAHTPAGRPIDDKALGDRAMKAALNKTGTFEHISRSSDVISTFTHIGTHMDSLNHFGYDGALWNGFKETEWLGERYWHRCGSDKTPPIVARGIMLDVAGAHGVTMLPESYGITAADLQAVLKAQRLEVEPGDVVLVRTGRMTAWPDTAGFHGGGREPGLTLESATYLAERGAIIIGADNVAVEQWPSADPDNWVPVHTYLLAEAGVRLLEQANLEELAADKVYEFAFVAAPQKIRGSTATPIRPLAFPLRA